MSGLPKGAMHYANLPVGPYLVLDKDDMSRWSDLGARDWDQPAYWCLCERRKLLSWDAMTEDMFVVDWLAMPKNLPGAGGAATDWSSDRWYCFPIDSVTADQLFMKSIHGVTRKRWHELCDQATGMTTI